MPSMLSFRPLGAPAKDYTVEGETIKMKIGRLEINAKAGPSGVAEVHGTEILIDGKPIPLSVLRIELVGAVENGFWLVRIEAAP